MATMKMNVKGGDNVKLDIIHMPHIMPVGENKRSECAHGIGANPSTSDISEVCASDDALVVVKTIMEKKKGVDIPKNMVIEEAKKETGCDTEKCSLEKLLPSLDATDREIIKKTLNLHYKPHGPANNVNLLNNDNIDDVLERWAHKDTTFYHMKFQMIDFAGATYNGRKYKPTELGAIDMTRDVINKGFKTFAVVMNTDTRIGAGIHWFSLFCDFRKSPFTVEYFNSSGNKPPKQIQEWLIKTKKNIDHAPNNNRAECIPLSGLIHQKGETECGLYSLLYIWNRLNGIDALKLNERRIPDIVATTLRADIFTAEK